MHQTIEERLHRLERENRWLKTGTLLAVLLFGTLASSQGTQEVVRTRAIEVVGLDGKVRISMEVSSKGSPGVVLYNDKGEMRALLAATATGPSLTLYDKDETARAVLSVAAPGGILGFYDSRGKLISKVD